ncbi:hypothetical protein Tco_0596605 [Tanacetum coccineum]
MDVIAVENSKYGERAGEEIEEEGGDVAESGLTEGSDDSYVKHMLVRATNKGLRIVLFNSHDNIKDKGDEVEKPYEWAPDEWYYEGEIEDYKYWKATSALTPTAITNCVSGIEPLNGTNFSSWKEQVKISLGVTDLDYALRFDKPIPLTGTSTVDEKRTYEIWERSNRMSLMIMKNSISIAIRGAIPDSENA